MPDPDSGNISGSTTQVKTLSRRHGQTVFVMALQLQHCYFMSDRS